MVVGFLFVFGGFIGILYSRGGGHRNFTFDLGGDHRNFTSGLGGDIKISRQLLPATRRVGIFFFQIALNSN